MDVHTLLSKLRKKYLSIKCRELSEMEVICEELFVMQRSVHHYQTQEPKVMFHLSMISALIGCEVAKICFWESKAVGQVNLKLAWNKVKNHRMDPDYMLLAICILNELNAIALYKKKSLEKSNKYFELSQELWRSYEFETRPSIMTLENIFLDQSAREAFRASHTFDPVHNLHKVFKQSYSDSLARTLLLATEKILKDYDEPFAWSRTLFRLAGILIVTQKFSSARYILSCASALVEHDINTFTGSTEGNKMLKKYWGVTITLHNYWGSYSTLLLGVSGNMKKRGEAEFISSFPTFSLIFPKEFKGAIINHEGPVYCGLVAGYKIAAEVRNFGWRHFKVCQDYHLEHQRLDDYMSTRESINHLFENSFPFYGSSISVCRMRERAVAVMEGELKYFREETHSKLTQRLLFQLIYWCSAILHLKMSMSKHVDECVKRIKVKTSCDKLITFSQLLLDHFTHGRLSYYYSDDDAYYALHACVCLNIAHIVRYVYEHHRDDLQRGEIYGSEVLSYVKRNPQQARFINHLFESLTRNVKTSQELLFEVYKIA